MGKGEGLQTITRFDAVRGGGGAGRLGVAAGAPRAFGNAAGGEFTMSFPKCSLATPTHRSVSHWV